MKRILISKNSDGLFESRYVKEPHNNRYLILHIYFYLYIPKDAIDETAYRNKCEQNNVRWENREKYYDYQQLNNGNYVMPVYIEEKSTMLYPSKMEKIFIGKDDYDYVRMVATSYKNHKVSDIPEDVIKNLTRIFKNKITIKDYVL